MRLLSVRLCAILLTCCSAFAALAEFRLELVRESLTGTHCRSREYRDGIATDHYVVRPCTATTLPLVVAPAERAAERIVEGRRVRRVIVEEGPLEPFAYDYDAVTGVLLRRTPLFFRSTAQVFHPNPVVTLNDPTLQDRNDAALAVPPSAYAIVTLQDVAPFGPLRGPHATLVDRQPPNIAPPDGAASLVFDREQDGFEDVNAYFHVDVSQRYLQSLGYVGRKAIVPYAIEIDAHALSGGDNSLFLPSAARAGYGTLFFGEGGTDDAEDADLVVHEYTHAILEWIAPGTFGGSFPSQARALAEGYGDYWAWSAHVDERLASGRDPYCFADWDARCWEDTPDQRCAYPPGSDCLRRLDSTKTMSDYQTTDRPGVEHENGAIWASALREIRESLGREMTDRLVIESLFEMPPQPTFAAAARRLLIADGILHGGANTAVLCAAMNARGILEGCGEALRGELSLWQSTDGSLAIPENSLSGAVSSITITDPRAIERLLVRVDIDHSARGDLRIELIAPDGSRAILQQVSFERTADVHATFGLDTASYESLDVFRGRSAAGVWQLVVRDLRPLDQGRLLSWGLLLELEGDTRDTARPRGAQAQMIPVVAHVVGVGGAEFRSDVRLSNTTGEDVIATLVFTPSARDGRSDFSSVNVALRPGQTAALDDIVSSVFHTAGSGSVEVLGDVHAASRTYVLRDGGTLGQFVPAQLETTTLGEPALTASAFVDGRSRFNAAIVETSGAEVLVEVAGREVRLAPFAQLQFPVSEGAIEARVIAGNGTIAAYLSQVSNVTHDAIFIPAIRFPQTVQRVIAPAVRAAGVSETQWESDVWLDSTGPRVETIAVVSDGVLPEVHPQLFGGHFQIENVLARLTSSPVSHAALIANLSPGTIARSRIRTGGVAQFVPFLPVDAPSVQHLSFIENGARFRTNIGIVSEAEAIAEVVTFDAGGTEISRDVLGTRGGLAQFAVLEPVRGGRATVRFVEGGGRAYASLIDNRTQDATYVPGQ